MTGGAPPRPRGAGRRGGQLDPHRGLPGGGARAVHRAVRVLLADVRPARGGGAAQRHLRRDDARDPFVGLHRHVGREFGPRLAVIADFNGE